jgi:DnaJ domain
VSTDYYAVLGVHRDANADEIKMAYRRLARELHPDVNPDPATQERFKEINQAHEVLSDPNKRQMYDLGGDPFAPAGGYFGQARTEPPERDGYPQGRWESHRDRWPPGPSDGAWKQSWDQAPYSAYRGGQPPSFSYDWQPPPAVTPPYRPRPFFQAIALMGVVLAVAVLVVTLRAPKAGPLGHPFQVGMECLGLDGHQVMTYGVEWVRNPGTVTAVIDQMTLAKPEGMRVVAAWVVPTSGLLYGVQDGYPPSKMRLPGWQWAKRQPANGAHVPHTPGTHNRENLVLVFSLRPGITSGQAAGIDIFYHVGSSHYHLTTAQRLVLGPGEVAMPPC